ncbi:hypothetical protein PsorP6_012138 [Peronosclerospora sorghi]|uniref:Uncharacterized protein n=1 Tax=Peronosclerospora sorghi TaxID=230839 RepID=A0ACC0WKR5_9STRA|nr:hypothetical protein PsorP6_012138 [Peronosclerospora sorghi]
MFGIDGMERSLMAYFHRGHWSKPSELNAQAHSGKFRSDLLKYNTFDRLWLLCHDDNVVVSDGQLDCSDHHLIKLDTVCFKFPGLKIVKLKELNTRTSLRVYHAFFAGREKMCSIGWSYKMLRLVRIIKETVARLDRLSSLAYEILQDNVVYNARLCRLLLNICLPTHLALSMKTFVTLERKIGGIIQTCRNDFNVDTDLYSPRRGVSRSHRRPGKKKKAKKNVAANRKRLRQGFDTSSSDDRSPNSDSDFDSSYSSGTDASDEHQSFFGKGNGYTSLLLWESESESSEVTVYHDEVEDDEYLEEQTRASNSLSGFLLVGLDMFCPKLHPLLSRSLICRFFLTLLL